MALKFLDKPMEKLRIKSFTRDVWYEVSVPLAVCSCPKFQKTATCKHLDTLGIRSMKPFTPKTHPSYSQALAGVVKSLRIRRVEEAVYWMMYIENAFKTDNAARFRLARRLLIGTAEDGHNVATMEKCAANFPKLCRKDTDLLYLVAEAVRICKMPNWWHPDSGGVEYIYQSLLGERLWLYEKFDGKVATAKKKMLEAIEQKNQALAIGTGNQFWHLKEGEKFGATEQAEWFLELAENREHELAARLCEVHLQNKAALSGDNNFLGQAVWMMAGGKSLIASHPSPSVTAGECYELIEKAKEAWKTPHPIPTWACDGVHSAGNDPRFMGMFVNMVGVCRAFEHYGRIDPNDEWLPSFRCWDGLVVETVK